MERCFDVLRAHISKKIDLTEEEFARCTTFFVPKKLRKKQFLLREEEVCRHQAFVTKGCLRSYTIDTKGKEHVLVFAVEGWWISDMHSYLTGEPATYNIDTLEDSEVLLLNKAADEKLCLDIPKFERYFRLLYRSSLVSWLRRTDASLSLSAEEKYLWMLQTYPNIPQRLPDHQIASYLGVTPESLSRLRKHLSRKKSLES
ncbi:MAG: Crp/Fnr family transcriptional regulator [Bacteroidota bacterium]